MSDYYDRDELTRAGHVPLLTSGGGGATSSCSCGWSFAASTITGAVLQVRDHIARVDDGTDGTR